MHIEHMHAIYTPITRTATTTPRQKCAKFFFNFHRISKILRKVMKRTKVFWMLIFNGQSDRVQGAPYFFLKSGLSNDKLSKVLALKRDSCKLDKRHSTDDKTQLNPAKLITTHLLQNTQKNFEFSGKVPEPWQLSWTMTSWSQKPKKAYFSHISYDLSSLKMQSKLKIFNQSLFQNYVIFLFLKLHKGQSWLVFQKNG